MDFGDIGSSITEQNTEAAIAKVRTDARTKQYALIGKCYVCEVPMADRPFCSSECRDEYEYTKRRMIANGGRR